MARKKRKTLPRWRITTMLLPRSCWDLCNPDPSLSDLIQRYQDVEKAIEKGREIALTTPVEWMIELLGHVPWEWAALQS